MNRTYKTLMEKQRSGCHRLLKFFFLYESPVVFDMSIQCGPTDYSCFVLFHSISFSTTKLFNNVLTYIE